MTFRTLSVVLALSLASPSLALASSPEAWAEFRTEVRARCLSAAQGQGMRNPEVIVHPVGTPSYGVAVLREKTVELTPAT
jgi:hypothetical protein